MEKGELEAQFNYIRGRRKLIKRLSITIDFKFVSFADFIFVPRGFKKKRKSHNCY